MFEVIRSMQILRAVDVIRRINCSPPRELPYCFFEFAKESSKMASNKRDLKIISIAQLVMAGILFVLGMVDHFEVRYMYASLILMPIWIALLVSILYFSKECKYKALSKFTFSSRGFRSAEHAKILDLAVLNKHLVVTVF